VLMGLGGVQMGSIVSDKDLNLEPMLIFEKCSLTILDLKYYGGMTLMGRRGVFQTKRKSSMGFRLVF
jgi:hypothetical protein